MPPANNEYVEYAHKIITKAKYSVDATAPSSFFKMIEACVFQHSKRYRLNSRIFNVQIV